MPSRSAYPTDSSDDERTTGPATRKRGSTVDAGPGGRGPHGRRRLSPQVTNGS